MIEKIVSGGQTGVDRAALDTALALDISCGGWCPLGRKAEDGALASHYPLNETPTGDYAQRTEWNVRDSDGTLVILCGEPEGGTKLTIDLAKQYGKPCCIVSIHDGNWLKKVQSWLAQHRIRTLNVAGPRESKCPGIYQRALAMLRELLSLDGDAHEELLPASEPGKFTQGPTLKHVVVMSAAGAVGLMAIFAVDLLNLLYISWLGNTVLTAAVGFASAVIYFLVSTGIGIMIAVTALVSRAIGERNRPKARHIATAGMLYMFAAMTLLSLALLAFMGPLLTAMGASGDTYAYAYRYLLMIIPTTPLLGLGMAQTGILRAVGDARLSMWVTLGSAIFTAAMDPLFIFVFKLGLDGAAIVATLARFVLIGIGGYGVFYIHKLAARPTLKDWNENFMPLNAIALPTVLTNVATPFANGYITAAIAAYGDAGVAAWAIISRMIPVAFGASFALSGAIGPILGQNFGAGLFNRLRRVMRDGFGLITIYILAVWAVLFSIQNEIVMLFSATGETAELIRFYCTYVAGTFLFIGMLFTANAVFNNLGFPLLSTVFNWSRATLGTIPFILVFGYYYGVKGVMIGQGVGAFVFGAAAVLTSFIVIGRLEKNAKSPRRSVINP